MLANELPASVDGSGRQFRLESAVMWWFTLVGPFAFTFTLWVALGWIGGIDFLLRLTTNTFFALWFFGRFLILAGNDDAIGVQGAMEFDGALSSFQLFLLITYLDTMVASVLAFHIGLLFQLPVIGPRIATLVADGQYILSAQPWIKQATFLGLIAFVGFPLAATGSVGGSIFGRLLGMGRAATFFGIVIGSLLGNGTMFLFSDLIGHWIDKDQPIFRYGGILVMVLIILFLERRYRLSKTRFAERNIPTL